MQSNNQKSYYEQKYKKNFFQEIINQTIVNLVQLQAHLFLPVSHTKYQSEGQSKS